MTEKQVLYRKPINRPVGQQPRLSDRPGYLVGVKNGVLHTCENPAKASRFGQDEATRIRRELKSSRWETRSCN